MSLVVSLLGCAVKGIVELTSTSPPILSDSQRSSVASSKTCSHIKRTKPAVKLVAT